MDSPTPIKGLAFGSSGDLPLTPRRYSRKVLKELPHEELVEKVIELESVLCEFQESSKELESALEEELQELELANTDMQNNLKSTQRKLDESHRKILVLSQEVNLLQESNNIKTKEHEDQIHALKQQIVSIEIANDSMESQDRMISNKLDLTVQFNNELLERLAIMENDLERERRANLEKELYISNYQNEVRDLSRKLEEGSFEADTSVISMREVLNAGPPSTANLYHSTHSGLGMPKSNSLKKLQDMTKEVSSFIRKSTTASGLKASPTTLTTEATVSKEDTVSTFSPMSQRTLTSARSTITSPRSIRSTKSAKSSIRSLSGSPATKSSFGHPNDNITSISPTFAQIVPTTKRTSPTTPTSSVPESSKRSSLTASTSSTSLFQEVSSSSSLKSNSSVFSKESQQTILSDIKTQYKETKQLPRRRIHELPPIKGSPNPERLVELDDRPRSKLKIFGR